jgi:hypothetical protein
MNAVLRVEQVVSIADQIADPNLVPSSQSSQEETPPTIKSARPLSRAQAIFKAAEEPGSPPTLHSIPKPGIANQAPPPPQKKRRGISGFQLFILLAMGALGCCGIVGLTYYLFFLN